MIENSAVRPYAKAAFEFAQQHQVQAQWTIMLDTMAKFIAQTEVQQFLKNPRYTAAERLQMCLSLGESCLDEPGANFIRILAANNRLAILPSIAEQFAAYQAAAEKVLPVRVKSAVPLNEAILEKLSAKLAAKQQSRISLKNEVDPNLLGGLMIYLGDRVIDDSLLGQFARLRETVIT